jgi:quinoprotein glucose dehydrogenase
VTTGFRLIALNAKTGAMIPSFGEGGFVDMKKGTVFGKGQPIDLETGEIGLHSTPTVVKDVVIVGSAFKEGMTVRTHNNSKGHVRAFDVRTGKMLWQFNTIPKPGELGSDTWENESWATNGNVGVWTQITVDEEAGLVYLPVETPSSDFYGGHRPGNNLFAESLVCIDLKTGQRKWHYQVVHHPIWDYDLSSAPILLDITVNGKPIKAVAMPSKQSFLYTFDRITGQPVWPIEEQPVPASSVPGESASKTQPFPSKPAPIDIQGVRDEDLIDFTPELHNEARDIVAKYDAGPLFTPPSERGTIQVPGVAGGGNWAGAAIDPETGMLYVGTYRLPFVVTVRRPWPGESRYDFIGEFRYLSGPRGLPLLKPPYGSMLAIDMNSGDHRWRIPVGRAELIPTIRQLGIRERLGFPTRNWALLTKTVMIVVQSGYFSAPRLPPGGTRRISDLNNFDPHLWVYDKTSGEMLAEMALPANAVGAPMTYMAGGRQFIVFPVGGGPLVEELIAVSL